MNTTASTPLFACSRCFSRHPFEELSPGEQLCKECRGSFPVVKCTYCRSEFQQTSKSNTSSICKKCEANVKAYGKPTACEYCNIIAAFIGNKCQRCTNSERKYGAAVTCEQCKQRCAFDRHDDDKKVEGKLLCWLCTQSLKRALARTARHLAADHQRRHKSKSSHKEKRKWEGKSAAGDDAPADKKTKLNPLQGEAEATSSEHVVALTQLKETIAALRRQLQQKDAELLAKEQTITALKAQHHNSTADLRQDMRNKERHNETRFNLMSAKIQALLREVAALSKAGRAKRRPAPAAGPATAPAPAEHSSGTDSPATN